MDNLKAAVTRP